MKKAILILLIFFQGPAFAQPAETDITGVWKGDFLDVTPMWNDRGNGMSIPQGSVLNLNNQPTLALIASEQTAWPASYGETDGFRQRGYEIDAAGRPTFKYDVAGVKVEDQIRPDADSKFLNRELRIAGTIPATLKCRLASGKEMRPLLFSPILLKTNHAFCLICGLPLSFW